MKGNKNKLYFRGEGTAVSGTSITVSHAKKNGGAPVTKTITVPTGTPITDHKGATVPLSDLVGKPVKIEESTADTAQSIVVKKHKGGKKTQA